MHQSNISTNIDSGASDFSPTSTLLTRTDTDEHKTLVEDNRSRSRYACFSPALLLLTSSVVLVTAGLGATMVFWFAKHTSQENFMAIWNEGAFLLDEGTHTEGGLQAAQLTGLTIASAASIATSVAMPILISLYAYRASYIWMKARKENLPTPLQYGLLIEALSAFGILSLLKTGRYFFTSSKKRRRIPYVLKEVFCVSHVSYILVHIVGALDLWLHVASLTFDVDIQIPTEPLNLSVTQEVCRPYDLETYDTLQNDEEMVAWSQNNTPCGLPYPWTTIFNINEQGLLLALNNSDLMTINILEAEQDLAVLVATNVPENVAFDMTTFGARATCTPIISLCDLNSDQSNGTCISAAPEFRWQFTSSAEFISGFANSASYPITNGLNAVDWDSFRGMTFFLATYFFIP